MSSNVDELGHLCDHQGGTPMTSYCVRCGRYIAPEAGARVPRVCTNCNTVVSGLRTRCPKCGRTDTMGPSTG